MTSPTAAVLNYHLTNYVRTWRGSVLSSFVLPVLFVLGFGVSVGRLVDAGGRLPGSYLAFVVPGMIASAAMQLGFGEATYPVMARFQWNRVYDSMIAAPLSIPTILRGELAFLCLRFVSTAAVFLAVTAGFGAVASWWALLVPLIAVLVGLAFAAPTIALTARIKTAVPFSFAMRFVIIPMSLFAGVFFPVGHLGAGIRWFAYVSPLWHGVELCRDATTGHVGPVAATVGHLAYLGLWAGGGLWLAYRSFTRRLSD